MIELGLKDDSVDGLTNTSRAAFFEMYSSCE
jgi:hypothetical protein